MRPLAGVLKVEFLDRVGQRWTKPPLRRRLEVLQTLSTLFDQFHRMGLARRRPRMLPTFPTGCQQRSPVAGPDLLAVTAAPTR